MSLDLERAVIRPPEEAKFYRKGLFFFQAAVFCGFSGAIGAAVYFTSEEQDSLAKKISALSLGGFSFLGGVFFLCKGIKDWRLHVYEQFESPLKQIKSEEGYGTF
ncbi:MAG: hypothetical protein WC371_00690 [Parachlamydiales bacterium]|jgi:hypothetical protein